MASGSRTGDLTVTAAGVTTTVPLSGHGPSHRDPSSPEPDQPDLRRYGCRQLAATQTVAVTNFRHHVGRPSPLFPRPVTFGQTNNCRPRGRRSCTVTVSFTPDHVGTRTGAVDPSEQQRQQQPDDDRSFGSGNRHQHQLAAGRPGHGEQPR